MYKIEAIVRPERFDSIQESLYEIDLVAMTTTEVKGTGRSKAGSSTVNGSLYGRHLSNRLKVEVIVNDEAYEEALEAFTSAAQTGEIGDGKIFVTKVHEVIRIRTGERGIAALE